MTGLLAVQSEWRRLAAKHRVTRSPAAEDKYLIDSSVKGSSMSEQSMSGAERHRQGISQAIHLAVPTVMVTHMVDGRSPAVVSGMTCQLYLHPCVDLDRPSGDSSLDSQIELHNKGQ